MRHGGARQYVAQCAPLTLTAELAIRGVRSYDPKSIHIIQFFKPLTVIVGHNGSGKTVGGVGGGAR